MKTLSQFLIYNADCYPGDYSTQTIHYKNQTYEGRLYGDGDFEYDPDIYFQAFYTDGKVYLAKYLLENAARTDYGTIDWDPIDWAHPFDMKFIENVIDDTNDV